MRKLTQTNLKNRRLIIAYRSIGIVREHLSTKVFIYFFSLGLAFTAIIVVKCRLALGFVLFRGQQGLKKCLWKCNEFL